MSYDEAIALLLETADYEEDEDDEEYQELESSGIISYATAYFESSFHEPSVQRLQPGCPLYVEIVNCVSEDKEQLNPYLYAIKVKHGEYVWTIKQHYKQFAQLHHHLLMLYTSLRFPNMTKKHKLLRSSFKSKKVSEVPSFPLKPDYFVKKDSLAKRRESLEKFLQEVVNIEGYRCFYDTLVFLGISPLSFVDGLGSKRKEGFVQKYSGGYNSATYLNLFRRCISMCWRHWLNRWLVLKDNFLVYINADNGHIGHVLLVDRGFCVNYGLKATGYLNGLKISNTSRNLLLKCQSEQDAADWCKEIKQVVKTTARDFKQFNPHESFAPVRHFTHCRWIVDGATYFDAVASALDKAKEEIFITGWWLVPEFYMKRPTFHGHYWQLDHILKRKATKGVKIFILLYRELELALGIHSAYSADKLMCIHQNIKVLRHPPAGVFLWAHHEKIVCIDQTYAFIGGLDICYGRWDDYQHRLTDLGEIEDQIKVLRHMSTLANLNTKTKRSSSNPDLSPDVDALYVPNKPEERKVSNHSVKFLESTHDKRTSKNMELQTEKHERNKVTMQKLGNKALALAKIQAAPQSDISMEELPTAADVHRTIQEITLVHLGIERKFRLWHGKDYTNFINKDITDLFEPYSDTINRLVTPRMPWHDVSTFVQGAAARDIGRHFIQRWNYAKAKFVKYNNTYPYLLPKGYLNLDTVHPILTSEVGTMFIAECQILRSACQWSAGIEITESSIHNAYISTIAKAKHFIYIENQFFVTQSSTSKDVLNGINDALYEKIMESHHIKRRFRVYVVMPLLPAFEGEVGAGSGTVMRAVTHWNYKSICRGTTSLFQRLAQKIKNPSQYITFCGLRTHGILNNNLVTELVYVHSKVMIVDDRYAIIGSANINDRSMLGRRDSEIAVLVHDNVLVDSTMDGSPYQAGSFCSSLRKTLFREHLGAYHKGSHIDAKDPVSDEFFNLWWKTAVQNTKIYETVFKCIPSNKVRSFQQWKTYQKQQPLAATDPLSAAHMLKDIRGYLVLLPFKFFCEENLAPSKSDKEHYLPNSLWT